MRLSELFLRAEINLPDDICDVEISGIVSNSTRAYSGCLYICLSGISHDGHKYAEDALKRGAAAVVCQKKIDGLSSDALCIFVDSTREAMARLYSAWYDHPQNSMKIIGVTGTNGKTTVSRMIYEILYASGARVGLIGTVGCLCCGAKIDIRSEDKLSNLTTPDPEELYKIFSVMRDCGAEYAVMEVSSHALALCKVAPIKFEVGVFTNLTPEHLDFHGDMESYFEAKSKLFSVCKKAVINCDDIYGHRLARRFSEISVTCSLGEHEAAVYAEQISCDRNGIEYKIVHPKMRTRIFCAIPGEFTVMNSMQAAVCAHELGISARDIKSSLSFLSGIPGRLERVELDRRLNFSVFIDFAHTPDALENLLRTARGFAGAGQRIVLLFGCGGDRDRYKRAHMGRIASAMADFVIITSDNSRSEERSDIICEILSGVDKESSFTVIEDRAEAIEYAMKNAREKDIIILAGKGHENYEIDKNGKKYFCERELAVKFANKYHLSEDV